MPTLVHFSQLSRQPAPQNSVGSPICWNRPSLLETMATAPCQLQAQVNDFTKSYSNPDIKSMDTSASSSPLVPRRLRTDSTRSYESSLDKVSDDQREKDARSLLRKSPKKDESGHHNG